MKISEMFGNCGLEKLSFGSIEMEGRCPFMKISEIFRNFGLGNVLLCSVKLYTQFFLFFYRLLWFQSQVSFVSKFALKMLNIFLFSNKSFFIILLTMHLTCKQLLGPRQFSTSVKIWAPFFHLIFCLDNHIFFVWGEFCFSRLCVLEDIYVHMFC